MLRMEQHAPRRHLPSGRVPLAGPAVVEAFNTEIEEIMPSHFSRLARPGASTLFVLSIAACGGGSSSIFEGASGASGASGAGGGGGSSGIGADGSLGSGPSGSPADGGFFPLVDGAACATSTAMARLTPLNLVIMYDKSGSMGDTSSSPTFDPALKWIPVNAGMKAFFADPGSQGLAAALTFFPVDGDLATACAGPYDAPKVALTSLADSTPFVTALDTTKPYGGTPTLPALQGAIKYANQVWQAQPDSLTPVVLVTDGEPGFFADGMLGPGCTDNDVDHVAAAAKAAFEGTPSIKTYVIGVGPSLDKLNAIAAAGGTGQAMMIPVNDPAQTKIQIQSSLSSIRTLSLSCNLKIPDPPDGSELDIGAVNVVYAGSSSEQQILGFNQGCSGGIGWQYDNPVGPTRVELCPNTCTTAQGDTAAKLAIMFGCKTMTIIR
jgi:hypothetical protein